MQIYADVLNIPVKIASALHGCAYGSAMFAAVAAGKQRGGYDSIKDAVRAIGGRVAEIYYPKEENVEIYNELYDEYVKLHDYFGRGENNVMKRLKAISLKVKSLE